MAAPSIPPELAAALVEVLPDGVVIADSGMVITHASPAVGTLLGCEREALLGQSLASLYWDVDDGRRLTLLDRAAPGTAPATRVLRAGSGERRVCVVEPRRLGAHHALVIRGVGDAQDTLDRMIRSEASFRAVIESAPDIIAVHQQGRLVFANRTLREGWGGPLEQLIGMPALELVHPDDRAMVIERQRALLSGEDLAPYVDERLLRHDGSIFVAQVGAVNVVFEGKPSVLVVARDVTEQRALEARLAQADRMVALGTLAAGVAHEIGNPLTYVLLRLDAAMVRTAELRRAVATSAPQHGALVEDLAGHVAAVSDGARRVRNIVSELKVFARGDDQPERLDVTVPLERALAMAAHELKGVALERDITPAPPVLASEGKLTQVFLNLVINAIHAVRERGAGDHHLRVRVWAEGGETRVAITDTGVGIAPEDVNRIFDPFYSTRPPGEGVGLGLAITQSIVASLGGVIRVDSRPGAGSTFTVALPSLRA